MKKAKFMLVAALLFSAGVASAAITYDTIDFNSGEGPSGVSGAALGGSSNAYAFGGLGYFLNSYGYQQTMQFDFTEAVRFTSIDLGVFNIACPTRIEVVGILGSVETVLLPYTTYSAAPAPIAITDISGYTSLKLTQDSIFGVVDNIAYNFGEGDPPPAPVPAPGALVLAGLGTWVASLTAKRLLGAS
jgi:hypothetical protein